MWEFFDTPHPHSAIFALTTLQKFLKFISLQGHLSSGEPTEFTSDLDSSFSKM